MKIFRFSSFLLFSLIFFSFSAAQASDVYLNGVRVNGMSNQKFDNAKVEFNERGDVFITVQGIQVLSQGGQNARREEPVLQKTYWLVSNQSQPGMTQYNIDVHINGKFVTRAKSSGGQVVLDISKHLSKGLNKVNFTAIKDLGEDPRKSFSPQHHFQLIMGEGRKDGERITIDKALIRYQRTAAEVANDSQEFTFQAR